jgi:hypothetical protein
MFVTVFAATLAALGTYWLVMRVSNTHAFLGLATMVASMAFVPLAAQYAWSGADYDLFYLVWITGMSACAVIALIRRSIRGAFEPEQQQQNTFPQTDKQVLRNMSTKIETLEPVVIACDTERYAIAFATANLEQISLVMEAGKKLAVQHAIEAPLIVATPLTPQKGAENRWLHLITITSRHQIR